VFTIVSVAEATASVPILQSDIGVTQDRVMGITIGVGVATILLTFLVVYLTANKISVYAITTLYRSLLLLSFHYSVPVIQSVGANGWCSSRNYEH
jgi:hypothetical protein